MDVPKGVNGMRMPIAMTEKVMAMTGHEARLWKKGTLRVRNHMYDQRLRQQPFDEPSRLEERLHLH